MLDVSDRAPATGSLGASFFPSKFKFAHSLFQLSDSAIFFARLLLILIDDPLILDIPATRALSTQLSYNQFVEKLTKYSASGDATAP